MNKASDEDSPNIATPEELLRTEAAQLAEKQEKLIKELQRQLKAETSEGKEYNDTVIKLIDCIWLYGGHRVDSRGPYGLILDAIQGLDPETAERLRNGELSEIVEEIREYNGE